jgi:hypothetical protein
MIRISRLNLKYQMFMKISNYTNNFSAIVRTFIVFFIALTFYVTGTNFVEAASLSLSPSTGVYTANEIFSVRVVVNTRGKPINAADGTLSFNPRELSVVSVNRSGSIFNLWVSEPAFSNGAGTINFSGGLPSGYTGGSGNIMTVTFRAAGASTARVSFTKGSVLANDGRGTNVLTAMNGGTYTIQAQSVAPEPEEIEYIAPANTPAAPAITSDTHPNPFNWYTSNRAKLNWTLPSGVVAVRTLLNEIPTSVPTKVYENPIKTISLDDLPEGKSYFHLQFKNADGWGKVTHYRLAVDSNNPTNIDIYHPEGANFADPVQTLLVAIEDEVSEVNQFKVKVDSAEPYKYEAVSSSSTVAITLPSLEPGYHVVIIEAFDQAGNKIVGTYTFTLESFDQPVFTEYPSEINEEVIPVIKGLTRPQSEVEVTVSRVGGEPSLYTVASDDNGEFIFIPEGTFSNGVYELTAVATDEFGAKSDVSDTIRIAVQQPGFLRVGSLIVSVLSVIVPLLVLVLALVLGVWYLLLYSLRFRKRVGIESTEALEILHREFSNLQTTLRQQESVLRKTRKTKKLTQAEAVMIEVLDQALQSSQQMVEKEILDVTKLTSKQKK